MTIERVTKVIKITPDQLITNSHCFDDDVTEQGEVIVRMYSYVFGDTWRKIEKLHGSPEVSSKFWQYICRRFMAFDHKVVNPRLREEGGERRVVLTGGAWMNSGFSIDERMDENTIRIDCEYTAKEVNNENKV